MAKKPKKDETTQHGLVGSWRPPEKRTGRPAKMPRNFIQSLDDLTKHTEAWIRRFDEVWFDDTFQFLENADGPANEEAPEWYEYAINRLLDFKERAEEGVKKLKKGKAAAKKNGRR